MNAPKPNQYGKLPLYELGDTVKVWPIFKNPIGEIERIVDAESFPIKYMVRYKYLGEEVFVDVFNEDDLTLQERRISWGCNCKTGSDRHSSWCNVTYTQKNWNY